MFCGQFWEWCHHKFMTKKNKMIFHFKNSSLKWNSFRTGGFRERTWAIYSQRTLFELSLSAVDFYVAAIYSSEYDLIKQTHNIRSLQTGSPNKLTLTNCMEMKGWIFGAKKKLIGFVCDHWVNPESSFETENEQKSAASIRWPLLMKFNLCVFLSFYAWGFKF